MSTSNAAFTGQHHSPQLMQSSQMQMHSNSPSSARVQVNQTLNLNANAGSGARGVPGRMSAESGSGDDSAEQNLNDDRGDAEDVDMN